MCRKRQLLGVPCPVLTWGKLAVPSSPSAPAAQAQDICVESSAQAHLVCLLPAFFLHPEISFMRSALHSVTATSRGVLGLKKNKNIQCILFFTWSYYELVTEVTVSRKSWSTFVSHPQVLHPALLKASSFHTPSTSSQRGWEFNSVASVLVAFFP